MCTYKEVIYKMKQQGIEFAVGLSDKEMAIIKQEYGIVFPKELMTFYKEALPISKGFYNWRDKSDINVKNIKRAMQMPIDEVIAGSEEIDWNEEWGEEPIDPNLRKRIISNMALNAPKLIPVYFHRYIAAVENERTPIFSICGTDIIYFAKSVLDYFLIELDLKENEIFQNNEVDHIPFWSDLL